MTTETPRFVVVVEVEVAVDNATQVMTAMTKGKTYVRKALRRYASQIGHPYKTVAQPTRSTRL